MWLIDASTAKLALKPFYGEDIPPYAILSHTWGDDEVSFEDFKNQQAAQLKAGWSKIHKTCEKALSEGLKYAWVDTCCIDKSSSAELSEAINSMFFWYQQATKCYVYLSDYEDGRILEDWLSGCRWFTRGWTLQELLAPRVVIFLNRDWVEIGTKIQICALLSSITSIPIAAILGETPLGRYSIAQRMSWAASRVTSRIEDTAYCLLGIFEVYMPLLYGERHRAFLRLQEEISKTALDMTMLAWEPTSHDIVDNFCSFLARSPASFKCSGKIRKFRRETRACLMSALGIQFSDKHPIRLISTQYDYFIDLGKIGKKPNHQIVSVAVSMIGPNLYTRNAQSPLRFHPYDDLGERGSYSHQWLYPIQLATKALHDSVRVKDSVHFDAHPLLQIVDGLPRKLWNESKNLFYHSRDIALRVLKIRGTVAGVALQLVLLVKFLDGSPSCLLLDQEEYPEQAANFLNNAWFEHNEGLLHESLETLHLNDSLTVGHDGSHVVITASIKSGVCSHISEKRIWIGSLDVTQT